MFKNQINKLANTTFSSPIPKLPKKYAAEASRTPKSNKVGITDFERNTKLTPLTSKPIFKGRLKAISIRTNCKVNTEYLNKERNNRKPISLCE